MFECQASETLDNGQSLNVSAIHVMYQFPFALNFHAPPSATLINVRGVGARPKTWQLTSLPTPLDKNSVLQCEGHQRTTD